MVAVNEKLMPGAEPKRLPVGNYYLLQDTLYRAVALTDSGGNIVEAYDTDAYGDTLIFTAADSSGNWWGDSATQSNYGANDIIFCGYRLDPETENYYVRNRFYAPALGRGYLDSNGNVWVPTGEGPTVHGGPHWDVQLAGGGHVNVYPGGNVR